MIRDGNARLLALIAFWIATRPADVRFGYFRDGIARFFALDAFPDNESNQVRWIAPPTMRHAH